TLAAGTSAELAVDVTAAEAGLYRVDADVRSGTLDPDLTNDVASIPRPDTLPTISDIPDQFVLYGKSTGPLAFAVGDAETPADKLTVTVTADDGGLLPAAGLVLGGAGPNRTLTIAPAPGKSGTARVTVTVTDPDGGTAAATFVVTVRP